MQTYIQYDEITGNILGTVSSMREPDVSTRVGVKQLEVTLDTDTNKKKVDIQNNNKIIDHIPTDFELLQQKYSLKDIVTIADNPAEWALFKTEIDTHKLSNGKVVKKALEK